MCQMDEQDAATGAKKRVLDEDQRAKNRLIVKRCYYKKLVRVCPFLKWKRDVTAGWSQLTEMADLTVCRTRLVSSEIKWQPWKMSTSG